jgi:hypothetical protein
MKISYHIKLTILILSYSTSGKCVPVLNSFPSNTSKVIYLDFDGETVSGTPWQSGATFICMAANFTDVQIIEIFNRVSEDYSIFDVNITTDLATFSNANPYSRQRVIITPTSAWQPGYSGVAYPSFNTGNDIPCFVFPDRVSYSIKSTAEICSHEAGHTLGLAHQALFNSAGQLISEYHNGIGTGDISWVPIMGVSFNKNMSVWHNGTNPLNTLQDDIALINLLVPLRTDDYPNNIGVGTPNLSINPTTLEFGINGIITSRTDKDVFKLVLTNNSDINFSLSPYSVSNVTYPNNGANIDLQLKIYKASGETIGIFNDLNLLNSQGVISLVSGDYYLEVDGVGNINTSDYGSLGSYTLGGIVTNSATSTLPSTPANLYAIQTNCTTVSLTWNPSVGSPAITYNVYKQSGTGNPYINIATGIQPNAFDDIAATYVGVTNYYVTATNTIGLSNQSNNASLSVLEVTSTPLNLTSSQSGINVNLNWTSTIGTGIKYNVYRAVGNGVSTLLKSGIITNSYIDNTISSGVNYCYTVNAVNNFCTSGFSNSSCLTIVPFISAPVLNLQIQNCVRANMYWQSCVSNENVVVSYNIFKKINADSYVLYQTTTSTNFNDPISLNVGNNYNYYVTSNSTNASAVSNIKSTSIPQPVEPPSNLTASQVGYNVVLTWAVSPTLIVNYNVSRRNVDTNIFEYFFSISGNNFQDINVPLGNYVYSINASPSIYNPNYQCTSSSIFSNTITVTSTPCNVANVRWNGSISTDWDNPVNWDCSILPDITSTVIMPAGLTRYPIVTSFHEIKSIFLQTGASIRINPNVSFKVNGQ